MLELDSGVARLIWVFFHDIHQDPGQMAPSQPREPPRSKVRTSTTLSFSMSLRTQNGAVPQ